MKTHSWTLHVDTQSRTAPAEGRMAALRNDPLGRTTRGVLILALVIGGLGAEAAAISGHGSEGHASNHPAGKARVGTSVYLKTHSHVTNRPWMY